MHRLKNLTINIKKDGIVYLRGGNNLLCNQVVLAKFQDEVLHAILHTDPERITLIWDTEDNLVLATKSAETYFNVYLHEIVNENIHVFLPNSLINRIQQHFKQTSTTMSIPQQVISSRHNTMTYFSIKIDQIKIESGLFYICVMQNITEIKRMQKKLYQLEKSMLTAQMSANVVHEIRNPLTAVKGFLQLLEAGIDYREQYVEVLLREVEKIEGLTNELLQMANPYKNKEEKVCLYQLITDVLLLIKAQTHMKDIQFEVSGDFDIEIYCKPTEIKQALINLILNGADAMKLKGLIKIHMKRQDHHVAIEVIDQGSGMSQQIMKEMNKEFYTTKKHGTGLGLVVTEQIIKDHRGKLSVFSIEDVGTTFEVQLPLRKA